MKVTKKSPFHCGEPRQMRDERKRRMSKLDCMPSCGSPNWQDLQRSLELLEYTILRKLKRKLWVYDYWEGMFHTNKAQQARAARSVALFEQSVRNRKAAWAAYSQKHGEKALVDLMLPKLERHVSFLEAKIKEEEWNEQENPT